MKEINVALAMNGKHIQLTDEGYNHLCMAVKGDQLFQIKPHHIVGSPDMYHLGLLKGYEFIDGKMTTAGFYAIAKFRVAGGKQEESEVAEQVSAEEPKDYGADKAPAEDDGKYPGHTDYGMRPRGKRTKKA